MNSQMPRPGDFTLCSPESRAAARAMIAEREAHAVDSGLISEIRLIEVPGHKLVKVIRIPPPEKKQTS